MPVSERIALVAPSAAAVVRNRDDLILELIRRGHRVLSVTPSGPPRDMRMLRQLGAQHREVDINHTSLPLYSDWHAIGQLKDVFQDWQPSITLGFGRQHAAWTTFAATRTDVRKTAAFVNETISRGSIVDRAVSRLTRGLAEADVIFAHNSDIVDQLLTLNVINRGTDVTVVPGAGVNIYRNTPQPLPSYENGIVFLMIAALDRSRGVIDYAKAAKTLHEELPQTRFLLAGPEVATSSAVTPDYVNRKSSGAIEYLGDLEDVRPAFAQCHVFVYPSHREGMPRAVLEALANGRPVITTNTSGCRETVDERVSGVLVDPGDVGQLVSAMKSFVHQAQSTPTMSRAARKKAERRFDANIINQTIINKIGID